MHSQLEYHANEDEHISLADYLLDPVLVFGPDDGGGGEVATFLPNLQKLVLAFSGFPSEEITDIRELILYARMKLDIAERRDVLVTTESVWPSV